MPGAGHAGSDHMNVFFNRLIASQFSDPFDKLCVPPSNMEEHTSRLYLSHHAILDSVTPLKPVQSNPRLEPWVNDTTCAAMQECRKAECKSEKAKLQPSYQI